MAIMPTRDAGIGLRPGHYRDLLQSLPKLGWLEVHSENYFGDGGAPLYYLEQARSYYPVSFHGVGLSLGSTDALNEDHLTRLKQLVDRFDPLFVSDHLCWSSVDGIYMNDLLPLPYTEEALNHFSKRVQQVQDYLGRELLVENPSSYLQYRHSTIDEAEFLAEVVKRSGCGLLLDVNNVYVSAMNHGFNAKAYIDAMLADAVREYHLAGHTVRELPQGSVYIDTHDALVAQPVWSLYKYTLQRIGRRPSLIEWDSNLPDLEVLLDEAGRAQACCEGEHANVA
jgi:uncharacterized protein (UPF0276 family)